MWFLTDDTGRVTATSDNTILTGGVWLEVPDGFTVERQGDYRIVGREFIVDPLPEPEPVMSLEERLERMEARVMAIAEAVVDEGIALKGDIGNAILSDLTARRVLDEPIVMEPGLKGKG